jgi:hypothetical protein
MSIPNVSSVLKGIFGKSKVDPVDLFANKTTGSSSVSTTASENINLPPHGETPYSNPPYHRPSPHYRPSPLLEWRLRPRRVFPDVQQLSGEGQPAATAHPTTRQTSTGAGSNALPPIGSSPSSVSTGAAAPAAPAPATSANTTGADGPPVRKRPKYTRSKAGCLVCRKKKIKCDEKQPTCTTCLHGYREVCTIPASRPTVCPHTHPTSV